MSRWLSFIQSRLIKPVVPVETGFAGTGGYPRKPVRFLAPGPAGGPGDIAIRLIAPRLSQRLGQPIIIDNHVNNEGLEIAAKAAADGYTVILAGGSTYIAPSLYRGLPYDPARDFEPVTLVAMVVNVLVVHASLPVNSMSELVSFAKARPGVLKYASSGIGSAPHLAAELFKKMAGIDIVHVPYRGHLAAGKALCEGKDVQLMLDAMPTAIEHVRLGDVKALAVTTATRSAALPEIPTMAECGLPGYDINPAMGVLAPAGASREIVERLHHGIVAVLRMQDIKNKLQSAGAEPVGSTPDEFKAYIKLALERWEMLVREAGVKRIAFPS